MDYFMKRPVKWTRVAMGGLLLAAGFYCLQVRYLFYFSLTLTGIWAFWLVYGSEGLKALFVKPVHPAKTILSSFVLVWIVDLASLGVIRYVFKLKDLAGNPMIKGWGLAILFILPVMLLGEELLSLFIMNTLSSKMNILLSSIISALIFGLLHFSTYYNGNIFQTIVHIIFLQGTARLVLNWAAVKGNSILTSWACHYLFDSAAVVLSLLGV